MNEKFNMEKFKEYIEARIRSSGLKPGTVEANVVTYNFVGGALSVFRACGFLPPPELTALIFSIGPLTHHQSQ